MALVAFPVEESQLYTDNPFPQHWDSEYEEKVRDKLFAAVQEMHLSVAPSSCSDTVTEAVAVEDNASFNKREVALILSQESLERGGIEEEEARLRWAAMQKAKRLPEESLFPIPGWSPQSEGSDEFSVSHSSHTSFGSSLGSASLSSFASLTASSFGSFSHGGSSATFAAEGTVSYIAPMVSGTDALVQGGLSDQKLDAVLEKMKEKRAKERKRKAHYRKIHYKADGIRRHYLGELEEILQTEEEQRYDLMVVESLWFGTGIVARWNVHNFFPYIGLHQEERDMRQEVLKQENDARFEKAALFDRELAEIQMDVIRCTRSVPVEGEHWTPRALVSKPHDEADRKGTLYSPWLSRRALDLSDEWGLLRREVEMDEKADRSQWSLAESRARQALEEYQQVDRVILTLSLSTRSTDHPFSPEDEKHILSLVSKKKMHERRRVLFHEEVGRDALLVEESEERTLKLTRYYDHVLRINYLYVPTL